MSDLHVEIGVAPKAPAVEMDEGSEESSDDETPIVKHVLPTIECPKGNSVH